jgi:hypothetical protein
MFFALQGQDMVAQAEGLGKRSQMNHLALTGRNTNAGKPCIPPFQGFTIPSWLITQGFALGYRILPFQGNSPTRQQLDSCRRPRFNNV